MVQTENINVQNKQSYTQIYWIHRSLNIVYLLKIEKIKLQTNICNWLQTKKISIATKRDSS